MDMITSCNKVLEGLKIKAKCIRAERHRHLAIYDLKLEPGCKVRQIETVSREIALGLRSKTNPIIIPITEFGIVRLTMAYDSAQTLLFNDLYEVAEKPKGILPVLLGETDMGKRLWVDFAMHPHTLIAGGTGSGKSTALHTIIANAVLNKDVLLYLVDPKGGVEFGDYKDIANLLTVTYDETLYMLEQIYEEMELRYSMLYELRLSSIEANPALFEKILIVIDEVADLMMYDCNKQNPRRGEFERLLIMLAQKSRAAGIYIVLATQRPSVDILKGTIKANFPARLSCRVSSAVDSKVILDKVGAESLLGRGDAILDNNSNDYSRFQVAYTTKADVLRLAEG